MLQVQSARHSDLSDLAISRVEVIPLQLPLTRSLKIAVGAERNMIEVLIVRIHTTEGLIGVGETQAWRRQGGAEILSNLANTIERHFQPLMLGRSAFDISGLLREIDEAYSNTLYAQAAVSDALYDVVGKALNTPVHRLLGGERRKAIRLGIILTIKPSVDELIASVKSSFDLGYRYFGLKIGIDPKQDLANAEAIRATFGDAISLRVDANAAMGRDAAISLLKKLEHLDLDAAEQPIAPWDLDGLAAIARSTSIPIMIDESLSTDRSLLDAIRRQSASAVHTKLAKNGGIHKTWRLWALAETAGLRICPGNHPCTGVATAAALQMCAAWPGKLIDGAFAVGVSGELESDITTHRFAVNNGEMTVPEGAGLGIELDMDRVGKFRVRT